MRRSLFGTAAVIAVLLLSRPALSFDKKNSEPKPQVLPLPKELPRALSAETQSLSFRVTPLLKLGRLSSQAHDALTDLIRDTRGATVVKLRAFVAGAGDARRVQELVSNMFSEKKLPLPVISILQVGSLGESKAAVSFEAVVSERKPLNSAGLAFLAGQTGSTLESAVRKLSETASAARISPADVLSVTCFVGRLDSDEAARRTIAGTFSQAAINAVQPLRDPADPSLATCEAVARLASPVSVNPSANAPGRVAFATAPELVFTGMQLSFGTYLDDANSALSRLERDLGAVHADIRSAVSFNAFSLDPAAVSALQKEMGKFSLPAETLTVQPVEGLPSLDAALGMEAVLVPQQSASTARM